MSTPQSEEELLARARAIAGRTIGHLADRAGRRAPGELSRAKGFVGKLVEDTLGGDASSRPDPDFTAIGVELKTIPVDRDGRPRESTYVCRAQLASLARMRWADSPLRRKLARVLWIPIEADRTIAVRDRKVGSPLLWSPTPEEEDALKSDWEELAGIIAGGFVDSIRGHRGRVLQLRPKAKNASVRTWGTDEDGAPARTLPRGFYLRRTFTEALLARHFALPARPR